jgi:hypothetical protein
MDTVERFVFLRIHTENRDSDVVALHVQYVHYKNTVINI